MWIRPSARTTCRRATLNLAPPRLAGGIGGGGAQRLRAPQWWRCGSAGPSAEHGAAVPHMLVNDNIPSPYRYLYPSSRDFVAVQARS